MRNADIASTDRGDLLPGPGTKANKHLNLPWVTQNKHDAAGSSQSAERLSQDMQMIDHNQRFYDRNDVRSDGSNEQDDYISISDVATSGLKRAGQGNKRKNLNLNSDTKEQIIEDPVEYIRTIQ